MTDADIKMQLTVYRRTIDNLDAALIHVLSERFRTTRQVGLLKAKHKLPPTDSGRELMQVERLRQLSREAGLDPDFAEKLLHFIIEEVIQHHKQIAAAS